MNKNKLIFKDYGFDLITTENSFNKDIYFKFDFIEDSEITYMDLNTNNQVTAIGEELVDNFIHWNIPQLKRNPDNGLV